MSEIPVAPVKAEEGTKERRGGCANFGELCFDASALSCFLTCPFKCQCKYVRKVEEEEPTARLNGWAWHEALATLHLGGSMASAASAFDVLPVEHPQFSRTRMVQRLEDYVERWKGDGLVTEQVEVEFKLDMEGGTYYTGRMDRLVRRSGELFVMDYKTTKGLGPTFFNSFRPSLQLYGYVFAARELCGECAGVIVDGISTAVNASGRTEVFGRDVMYVSEREVGLFKEVYREQVIRLMGLLCEEERDWPRNLSTCWSYYSKCFAHDLCVFGAEVG